MNVCLVINESVLHTGGVRGPRTRYLRKPLAPRGSRGSRKSFMVEERHYRHWRWRLRTGDCRWSDPVLQLVSRCSRQLLVIETILCMTGS